MPRKSAQQVYEENFNEKYKKAESLAKISRPLAIAIKNLKRGSEGLSPDEDVFSGLLNRNDIRERARLSIKEGARHSRMRVLATMGEGFEIWSEIANMEDTYSITKDGEQWAYAVEMLKVRSQPSTVIQTGVLGQPALTPPKKPSFLDRLKGKKETSSE